MRSRWAAWAAAVTCWLVVSAPAVAAQLSTFTETWTGTNGDPWPGQWDISLTSAPGADAVMRIQNNTGQMWRISTTGIARYNPDGYLPGVVDSLQVTQLSLRDASQGQQGGLIARASAIPATYDPAEAVFDSAATFYWARLDRDAHQLQLVSVVGGAEFSMATASLDPILGDSGEGGIVNFNWLRFEVEQLNSTETALRAKLWAEGTAEPANWTLNIVSTTMALQNVSGFVGVAGTTGGSSNRHATFDNYSVTAAFIPEPAALSLLGLAGLILMRRRKT